MWTRAFQTWVHLGLDRLVNSFCDNEDEASHVDICLNSLLVAALASLEGECLETGHSAMPSFRGFQLVCSFMVCLFFPSANIFPGGPDLW